MRNNQVSNPPGPQQVWMAECFSSLVSRTTRCCAGTAGTAGTTGTAHLTGNTGATPGGERFCDKLLPFASGSFFLIKKFNSLLNNP